MEKRSGFFFNFRQPPNSLHFHSSDWERMWLDAHCHVRDFRAFLTMQLSTHLEEPWLPSIKQVPFFRCTIAPLADAHTFLMAEISRHALTDLSVSRGVLAISTSVRVRPFFFFFFFFFFFLFECDRSGYLPGRLCGLRFQSIFVRF